MSRLFGRLRGTTISGIISNVGHLTLPTLIPKQEYLEMMEQDTLMHIHLKHEHDTKVCG